MTDAINVLHAVDLLGNAQTLADEVRSEAEATAAHLVASATEEAEAIRAQIAELQEASATMEHDFAIRQSLVLQDLTNAQADLIAVRAEANRILEEASGKAAQVTAEAARQADEVTSRSQADAELARVVTLQQLNLRRDALSEVEQRTRSLIQEEIRQERAAWGEEQDKLNEAAQIEQDKWFAEFRERQTNEETAWRAIMDSHDRELVQLQEQLTAQKQQIVVERLNADGDLKAQYETVASECEQMVKAAESQAAHMRQESVQVLDDARQKAESLRDESETAAAAKIAEAEQGAQSLLEDAQKTADEKVSEGKERAKQIRAEAHDVLKEANDQAAQKLADATDNAKAIESQARSEAEMVLSTAQAEVEAAQERAKALLDDAQRSVAQMHDEWASQAEAMRTQSAQLASATRAESARLLTEARQQSDAMRDAARALVEHASQEVTQMQQVRDGISQELAALTGAIDSLSNDSPQVNNQNTK